MRARREGTEPPRPLARPRAECSPPPPGALGGLAVAAAVAAAAGSITAAAAADSSTEAVARREGGRWRHGGGGRESEGRQAGAESGGGRWWRPLNALGHHNAHLLPVLALVMYLAEQGTSTCAVGAQGAGYGEYGDGRPHHQIMIRLAAVCGVHTKLMRSVARSGAFGGVGRG